MAESFKFLKMIDGSQGTPAWIELPVATTQTLTVGELVILSSNQVATASASVAAPLGVMAEDSSGATAGTLVKLYPILPGQVWRATADAAATAAVLGNGTYDINSDGTVDVGDASNGAILILRTRDSSTDIEVTFTKGVFF